MLFHKIWNQYILSKISAQHDLQRALPCLDERHPNVEHPGDANLHRMGQDVRGLPEDEPVRPSNIPN